MAALTSVLLVDDDPTTNYLNKLLLTRMGAAEQVLVAENGEQALRTLVQTCVAETTTCPRLILLDMNMPTTSLHPVDLARAKELPIAGFLNKPLTKEKVYALLQEHFASQ
jgi:DNA-binding response OmpR family regulator